LPVGVPAQAGAVPPPPPGALYYTTVDKDASDLKTLSIFWYIVAGLQALGSCIFLLYILFGLFFMVVGGAAGASSNEPGTAVPAIGFGAFFMCMGLIPMALILTLAYLNYTVAKSLPARKNLTLCYVMAAIICMGVPVGTVLGIFTFIILNRPSVKATFT